MLTTILLAACVAAPWVNDLGVSDAKPVVVAGDNAPADTALLTKKRATSFTVQGPATVKLTFHGVRRPKGKRLSAPGKVSVKVGKKKKLKTVTLDVQPVDGWSVAEMGGSKITGPVNIELNLDPGPQKISLVPNKLARSGYLLRVEVLPAAELPPPEPPLPGDSTGGTDTPPDAPPLPELAPLAPIPDGGDSTEPDLPPGGDEIDIPIVPGTDSPEIPAEPFTFVGERPGTRTVEGPDGEIEYFQITTDQPLTLQVNGPGQMVYDVHAYRSEAQTETLNPVFVGLLVDDVLVETVTIEEDVNPIFTLVGTQENLSERVTMRLPVSAGQHKVTLTLSDEATLGMLVAPRLDAIATVEKRPTTLVVEKEPERPRVEGGANLAVLFGGWLPAAVSTPGFMANVEANIGFPIANQALSVGLSAGFGRAAEENSVADPRVAGTRSTVDLSVYSLNFLADVRWTLAATTWLSLSLGAGGGAAVTWVDTESVGVTATSQMKVVPAGVGHLTALFAVGPGDVLLRGGYLATGEVNTRFLQNYSAGGAFVSAGYQFRL